MKMASKVTLFLFNVLLILQYVHQGLTNPQHDAKVIEELNDITEVFTTFVDEKPLPRVQLKIAIMHECGPLFNFTMLRGKQVLQNVLKDSELLQNPSDELETQLAEFRRYVEIVEAAENKTKHMKFFDVVEMANRFQILVERYNTTSLKAPTALELTIEAALQRNGLPALKADFNKLFMDTVPLFNAKIDAYLDLLTPKQRKEQEKLSEWYESFKAEQDVDQKRKIFADLITF